MIGRARYLYSERQRLYDLGEERRENSKNMYNNHGAKDSMWVISACSLTDIRIVFLIQVGVSALIWTSPYLKRVGVAFQIIMNMITRTEGPTYLILDQHSISEMLYNQYRLHSINNRLLPTCCGYMQLLSVWPMAYSSSHTFKLHSALLSTVF